MPTRHENSKDGNNKHKVYLKIIVWELQPLASLIGL